MTITEEMIWLNWAEVNRHRETARILREIVDKQRCEALKSELKAFEDTWHTFTTPHSDTDAHPENQGSDLFAANAGKPLFSERWRNGTLKEITRQEFDTLSKEQAEARDRARANHNPDTQYDFIRNLPKITPKQLPTVPGCMDFVVEEAPKITPEQARFAYDSALEGPTQAVPFDSRPLTASDIVKANEAHEAYWREHDIQDPSWCQGAAQLWYALGDAMKLNLRGPKHRWIYSDNTPRHEPCCK